jgi:hypothetical protein
MQQCHLPKVCEHADLPGDVQLDPGLLGSGPTRPAEETAVQSPLRGSSPLRAPALPRYPAPLRPVVSLFGPGADFAPEP